MGCSGRQRVPQPWTWRGGRAYEVPLLRALAHRGLPVPRDQFAISADGGLPVAIVEGGVPTQGISARWAFGAQTGEARPGVRLTLQGVKANLQETKGPPS
jgi:hypothetical protein